MLAMKKMFLILNSQILLVKVGIQPDQSDRNPLPRDGRFDQRVQSELDLEIPNPTLIR